MPRANRYFLPGHVWHITHRCHEKEFLLRFSRDRRLWRHWLYEAKQRYGLCVLDYIVTSNHIHLLVRDRGTGEIPRSMQLLAGRTAQAFNQRKNRHGAYWEDRYHATAVQTGEHLARCLVYIDLNMVRAGVVSHPQEWDVSGYREIQDPPCRYRVIDCAALMEVLDIHAPDELRRTLRNRVEDALRSGERCREDTWTQSLAVGSEPFAREVRRALGLRGRSRGLEVLGDLSCVREETSAYGSSPEA